MNVGGRDEAVRLDEGLEHNCLAVGLARGLEEDEPLSGDRFSMTSCLNHVFLLSSSDA